MLCALCGLDNDPSAEFCARCNATLAKRTPEVHPAPRTVESSDPRPVPVADDTAPLLQPPAEEPTSVLGPPVGSTAYPIPRPGRRGASPLPLIAAGVVILLLMVVVGIVMAGRDPDPGPDDTVARPVPTTPAETTPTTTTPASTPSSSPAATRATTPAASAQEQAAAVDALLNRSVASRKKLNGAIDKVRRCTGVSGALADMQEVGVERTEQISEINAADLSALGNGETLRSSLSTALGHSLDADQHFIGWAQPAADGDCGEVASRTAAWERGQSSSKLAQAAKKQFLSAWNPVAGSYGYQTRTNLDI
ncbi:hypothetical protein AMIS_26780 [Actinoplanes missouriensis 431]|uniref:Zinc-ribbon domain-containing protein n=1 Tax=Actinoplanes missouriensis (strain ATCC 14538 / DSM 43046 / CBS 188.64 / JCM 3121 / NBRC 102363 / NCIMB 12654 / NRRL B-3342 / UNCC 431) TaxID=512565 RepID=I0H4G1_ACTM4|nr:hypothetical protein [Actinoplanes missouriensis]BAL87898.1 hypothetical protein AMIS_26780 [Actinoplanes missouriensis 431]